MNLIIRSEDEQKVNLEWQKMQGATKYQIEGTSPGVPILLHKRSDSGAWLQSPKMRWIIVIDVCLDAQVTIMHYSNVSSGQS